MSSATAMTSERAPATTAMADPAADLVGTGCATYAEQVPSGPGSVTGMAQDPVAVAASNNPMLKTLTSALSGQAQPECESRRDPEQQSGADGVRAHR